ncbi:MAG: hypothetical protein KJT03_18865, partial [Verrucomicrobiae bacterium]|nr:hypothetical protein [Verrucomicrobiae bacterium]
PSMALQNVRIEAARLATRVQKMMNQVTAILRSSDVTRFDDIEAADDTVDQLHREILGYAGKISKFDLNDAQSREFRKLMIMVDALERVGDVIANDMVRICRKRINKDISSSEKLLTMQVELQEILNRLLYKCERAIKENNVGEAHQVLEMRSEIEKRIEAFFDHQESRFHEVDADRIAVFRIEMDLVEKQRRIFGLLERIAIQLTGASQTGPGSDLDVRPVPNE